MKKVAIGKLSNLSKRVNNFHKYSKYSLKNLKFVFKVPFTPIGVSFKEQETIIKPTQKGTKRANKKTLFVENNVEDIMNFYNSHKDDKEFKFSGSPYAKSIPLKNKNEGFKYGYDINEFKITVHDTEYKVPKDLLKHRNAAIELFKSLEKIRPLQEIPKEEDWENNQSVRIVNWDSKEKNIDIQPATYFDQVATNLTLDWASGFVVDGNKNATIRNNKERGENGELGELESSILANTLGIAVFLINHQEDEILIPIRGKEQAIMSDGKGQFHCSASGVFEWDKEIDNSKELKFDFFMKGMEKEIEREIGITRDQYKLIPLAFTRELIRGGKPQLFFVAETNISIKKLKESMKTAEENWEFIHEDDLPKNHPLSQYLTCPVEAPNHLFTYEGLMALNIILSYKNNQEGPLKIINKP